MPGITNFNLTTAYEAMYANAMEPQSRDGRGGLDYYIPYGFVPLEWTARGTCGPPARRPRPRC